jgi:hypothetical protein
MFCELLEAPKSSLGSVRADLVVTIFAVLVMILLCLSF